MANVIQIKHGSGAPSSSALASNELGFDTTNNVLYIGKGNSVLRLAPWNGGTITNNLTISGNADGKIRVYDGTHGGSITFGFGTNHQTHGLYSYGYAPTSNTWTSDAKWILYRDNNGEVILDGTASRLSSPSIGNGSNTTHATALQAYFNSNKSTVARNKLISFYDSSMGNGSVNVGYFLNGYNDNPYGGFFVAHYNIPYYVGIQNGNFTQYNLITNNGGTITNTLTLSKTQDASGTADNKPALIIGGESTAQHIEIDGNEILAKSNGTTSGTLYLQDSTGEVRVAGTGGLTVSQASIVITKGNLWAGTDDDTANGERDVGVRNGAGRLYLYSAASATGNRGLYVNAHGTGSAGNIIQINQNNVITYTGGYVSGNLQVNTGNVYAGNGSGTDEHWVEARCNGNRILIDATSTKRGIWADGAGWIFSADKGGNIFTIKGNIDQIVFSTTQPSSARSGLIWIKPV